MTRLEKLEAVAEAARPYAYHGAVNNRLLKALAALDAHTEAPQETVTLAAWRNPMGAVLFSVAGTSDDYGATDEWTRIGAFTLALTREGGR